MSGRRRQVDARASRGLAWDALYLGLCAAVLAGCVSAPRDGAFSSWWRKPVLEVVSAQQLQAGVDRRCLGAGEAAATVAVVAFRVGRVPGYRQAFALPSGADLQAGDTVWVRPRTCELEPAADRAAN